MSTPPKSSAELMGWLWRGYLRFYRARLEPEVTESTWKRLTTPGEGPYGLVAVKDGQLIGFTHYHFHRSTWLIEDTCYLQDLYVSPDIRGSGAGRALIMAVVEAAKRHGTERVYWLTQEYNADARALYDTLAKRTSFIVYRR